MNMLKAIELFKKHNRLTIKDRTLASYRRLLEQLAIQFADHEVASMTSEEVCKFLESFTRGSAKSTRHLRYAQMKAFFNFIIESCDLNIKNLCNSPVLFKPYKMVSHRPRKTLDKEMVDEIIFNSRNSRDRLMLELQARCGLRVGEVLNLKVSDLSGRKLLIQEPKSGKDVEVAFMPEHIAIRLTEYITTNNLAPDDRIFPVCYTTIRNLVRKLALGLNIRISPHDLRRHSATYASRNGVPLEIISKVILRHQDLKTTQIYLGRVSDSEAIRWMDVLHGK
jgi:integrase